MLLILQWIKMLKLRNRGSRPWRLSLANFNCIFQGHIYDIYINSVYYSFSQYFEYSSVSLFVTFRPHFSQWIVSWKKDIYSPKLATENIGGMLQIKIFKWSRVQNQWNMIYRYLKTFYNNIYNLGMTYIQVTFVLLPQMLHNSHWIFSN